MSSIIAVPAAQYLRMSTDHQQYSLHNQADAIRQYATEHGFQVVRSYVDSAKSGLVLKHREGLAQLLRDVVAEGDRFYKVILVYDVSRWGRFQDTDEAAHYEFLCKSAGIPIHYCAEAFVNDTTMPSIVMKTLKRVMAAEYSRELSEKVFQGEKNISQLGFRTGGIAGFGLRRMLCSPDGTPRTILETGKRKSLLTDRVILVLGPLAEVECVREIFKMVIEDRRTYDEIAYAMNERGISFLGRRWRDSSVSSIIKNPKYMGCHVWGRSAKKLGGRSVAVPEQYWIKKKDAFEAIITPETFAQAQEAIKRRFSDDELLERLRGLSATEGHLSERLINRQQNFPCSSTYAKRFGSLKNAFQLIGYQRKRVWDRDRFRRVRDLRNRLVSQLQELFPTQLMVKQKYPCRRPLLRFKCGPVFSISVSLPTETPSGAIRWALPIPRKPSDYRRMTLLCRCNTDSSAFQDFHFLPRIEKGKTLLKKDDPWLHSAKLISNLGHLHKIARSMYVHKIRKA